MLSMAPHPNSTCAALLRLAAAWLVVVLLVQGLAAAIALGQGPLHRHGGGAASLAAPLGAQAGEQAHDAAHHPHAKAGRHHHTTDDPSMLPAAGDTLDLAAFALTAALALLMLGQRLHAAAGVAAVRAAGTGWSVTPSTLAPLLKPPRTA